MSSFLVFFSAFSILLLRVCSIHSQANVFDVTLFRGRSPDITQVIHTSLLSLMKFFFVNNIWIFFQNIAGMI